MITKTIREKNNYNMIDVLWMFSIKFVVILGAVIPNQGFFIYFFIVCRGPCYDIFLTKDCVAFAGFLKNL